MNSNIHTFCRSPPAYCNLQLIGFHKLCRPAPPHPPFYSVPESIGLLASFYIFYTFVPFFNVNCFYKSLTIHYAQYFVPSFDSLPCVAEVITNLHCKIPNFRLRLKMDHFTILVWFVIVHGVLNYHVIV